MAVSLAQLKADSKALTVTYNDVVINLRYAPARYTPNFESELSTDEAERSRFLPTLLSTLITDWDIMVDESGVKVTIDAATLAGFGYGLLNKLATEIIKDLSPGRRAGSKLRRFLDGGVGEPPSEYLLLKAARYLGVPPWELANRPTFWREWALISEHEENQAQIEANRRVMAEAERRSRHESYAPVAILPRIAG